MSARHHVGPDLARRATHRYRLTRMICRIAGTLESLEGNATTLTLPGGVWREVLLPAYLAERLAPQVGRPLTLTTIEYLDSPNQGSTFTPRLVGFGSVSERRF